MKCEITSRNFQPGEGPSRGISVIVKPMDRLQHYFKPLDGSLHDTSSQVSWKHSYKSYNKHVGLLENYLLDMIGHDSTRIWHEFWVFWPLSWQNIYISSHISVELVKNPYAEMLRLQLLNMFLLLSKQISTQCGAQSPPMDYCGLVLILIYIYPCVEQCSKSQKLN